MTYSSRSCMMPVSGGSSPNDRPVPVVRRPRRLSVYSHRQHELRLLQQRCFQFYYLLYPASHRTSANYYSAATCPFLPYFWPFPRRYEGDEALNVSWRRSSMRSASNYHARGRLLVEREKWKQRRDKWASVSALQHFIQSESLVGNFQNIDTQPCTYWHLGKYQRSRKPHLLRSSLTCTSVQPLMFLILFSLNFPELTRGAYSSPIITMKSSQCSRYSHPYKANTLHT